MPKTDRNTIEAGLARLSRQFMTPSIYRGDAWERYRPITGKRISFQPR